jgi:hypothetical protein
VLQVSVKFSVKPALEFRVWFKPNTSGRLKAGPFFSSDESDGGATERAGSPLSLVSLI